VLCTLGGTGYAVFRDVLKVRVAFAGPGPGPQYGSSVELPSGIDDVAACVDQDRVATYRDDRVSIWEWRTRTLDGGFSERSIRALDVDPARRFIVSGGDGIRIRDTATLSEAASIETDAPVKSLSFSESGEFLVMHDEADFVRVWKNWQHAPEEVARLRLDKWRPVLEGARDRVHFSDHDRYLFVGSIRVIWDDGELLGEACRRLALMHDGNEKLYLQACRPDAGGRPGN